jgi:hypothetical protein
MRSWIRRLHLHTGLASSTALVLFAVAGLDATFRDSSAHYDRPPDEVRWVEFAAPPDLEEDELVRRVHAALDFALSEPVPAFARHRDADGHLVLPHYSLNGRRDAVVLPEEGRLRVDVWHADAIAFLSQLHAVTLRVPPRGVDWRVVLWSLYVELSIFALFAFVASGAWLWWTSRPRHRLARAALLAGSGALAALLAWVR